MAPRRTLLLLFALTTVALSATGRTDPNEARPELHFVMSNVPLNMAPSFGGVRPKYKAELVLFNDRAFSSSRGLDLILDGPWAQKLSQAQRDFLAGPSRQGRQQNFGTELRGGPDRDHITIELYAVSEQDAKIMASAMLDALTEDARTKRTPRSRWLDGLKREAQQRQAELAEKEKRIKEVDGQYDRGKKDLYPYLRDDEAAQLAKELIFQMDKEGKMLDIELAGIKAKFDQIEGYLSETTLDNHIRERLEGMKIDQMIELVSLTERRKAVAKIRTAEQEFYSLYTERRQLHQSVPGLRDFLKEKKKEIDNAARLLARPRGEMVPPKVHEDKVVIYPIKPADSQN